MRAFLAIPLDDAGEAAVEALQNSLRTLPALREFRWVTSMNVHLTLRFLGEIGEKEVRAAEDALAAASAGLSAFEFPLERFGVFPDLRRPSVVWTGPNETPAPLTAMAASLAAGLAAAGFDPENCPFRAHLTLGRRRSRDRSPAGLEGELEAAERRWLSPPPLLHASRAALYRSELNPGGAIYTPVRTVSFE